MRLLQLMSNRLFYQFLNNERSNIKNQLRCFFYIFSNFLFWSTDSTAIESRLFDVTYFQFSHPWQLQNNVSGAFGGHHLDIVKYFSLF